MLQENLKVDYFLLLIFNFISGDIFYIISPASSLLSHPLIPRHLLAAACRRPKEILVFIVGGATFEEAKTVAYFNEVHAAEGEQGDSFFAAQHIMLLLFNIFFCSLRRGCLFPPSPPFFFILFFIFFSSLSLILSLQGSRLSWAALAFATTNREFRETERQRKRQRERGRERQREREAERERERERESASACCYVIYLEVRKRKIA